MGHLAKVDICFDIGLKLCSSPEAVNGIFFMIKTPLETGLRLKLLMHGILLIIKVS